MASHGGSTKTEWNRQVDSSYSLDDDGSSRLFDRSVSQSSEFLKKGRLAAAWRTGENYATHDFTVSHDAIEHHDVLDGLPAASMPSNGCCKRLPVIGHAGNGQITFRRTDGSLPPGRIANRASSAALAGNGDSCATGSIDRRFAVWQRLQMCQKFPDAASHAGRNPRKQTSDSGHVVRREAAA